MVESEMLQLFHGTTLETARRIESGGFDPLSPKVLIEETADRHGVPLDEVLDRLGAAGRYTVRDARPGWVSFAPVFEVAAARWAQRAPEARWEALGAVYEYLHGVDSVDEPWWSTDAGQWWVQREMLAWTPAVVEIETEIGNCWQTQFSGEPRCPITEMFDDDAPTTGSSHNPAPTFVDYLPMMPELKIRREAQMKIVRVTKVKRLVGIRMALWLFEALDEDADRAPVIKKLGEPVIVAKGEGQWSLRSILRQLPADRLSELGCDLAARE